MNVYILLNTVGGGSKRDVLKIFGKGIEDTDKSITVTYYGGIPQVLQCDVLVMGCFFNKFKKDVIDRQGGKTKYRQDVYNLNSDKKWIFLDGDPTNGVITGPHSTELNYRRVSLNSIYPGDALYLTDNYSSDRWDKMIKNKNIDVLPWRTTGEHILLLLQSTKLFSIKDVDLFKWINNTISEIRKYSKRLIVVRKKPTDPVDADDIDPMFLIKDPINNIRLSENKKLTDDLDNAWISVLYSTSAGVSSIIRGIPTYSGSPDSLTYDVSLENIRDIESCELPDRTEYFSKLGYMLWNLDDFREGIVWNRVKCKL